MTKSINLFGVSFLIVSILIYLFVTSINVTINEKSIKQTKKIIKNEAKNQIKKKIKKKINIEKTIKNINYKEQQKKLESINTTPQNLSLQKLTIAIDEIRERATITWSKKSIQNTFFLIQKLVNHKDNENLIILFRGVNQSQTKQYKFALAGIAMPGGWGNPTAHADPILHNSGKLSDGKTWASTNSLLVGFTMIVEQAYLWATYDGNDGVILMKAFRPDELINSPDKYNEYEFLHYGPVTNCIVIPISDWKSIAKLLL
jgi:hypothetical protein